MAVFDTANGSSPGRCDKSYDSILTVVTKGNQLEVLSKNTFKKESLSVENISSKILIFTKCVQKRPFQRPPRVKSSEI